MRLPLRKTSRGNDAPAVMREQSFVRSLFSGVIDEDALFPWPEPAPAEVTTLLGILDATRRFCAEQVNAAAIDRNRRIPETVLTGLRQMGAFGLVIGHEHGGGGLSNTGYARVIQEVATFDSSVAVMLGPPSVNRLEGPSAVRNGRAKAALLASPRHRRDRGRIRAHRAGCGERRGLDPDRRRAAGRRKLPGHGLEIWVTNGRLADLFTVFARTSAVEDGIKPRITAFVIERGPGVASGPGRAQAWHPRHIDHSSDVRTRASASRERLG